MHAILMESYGGAEVLRPYDVRPPAAPAGWITVDLRAAALNWHDVLVRRGRYRSPLPHVPGADGAGVRTDTGEDVMIVPSLGWGDQVGAPAPGWQILGDTAWGTYAERVAVPPDCVVPKPAGYSWAEAAALPLVGLTTYRALFTRGRLAVGESLLVIGASGGIATTAIALAAAVGAKVAVTASSPEKLQRARQEGAFDGMLHTEPGWADAARALTPDRRGFDVVLDPVGRWTESIRALRPGGRLVVLGASVAETVGIDVRAFFFGQYDLLGTTMGGPRDVAGLLALIASDAVRPPLIDTVLPLDDAATAHARMEAGTGFGKIVLRAS